MLLLLIATLLLLYTTFLMPLAGVFTLALIGIAFIYCYLLPRGMLGKGQIALLDKAMDYITEEWAFIITIVLGIVQVITILKISVIIGIVVFICLLPFFWLFIVDQNRYRN